MKPKLYIISTPIGNYEDITLRALRILEECDFIICEEYKEARRLLAHYKIEKELFSLNEHNESESANELILKLLEGKTAGLISDCGTPFVLRSRDICWLILHYKTKLMLFLFQELVPCLRLWLEAD